tara:strand:- start:1119 stop:1931 length:813 start_codon:yes stop_codon:yes gene_type:complete
VKPQKIRVHKRTFSGDKVLYNVIEPKSSETGWLKARAEGLLIKEPETIKWLDRMGPDDVLWDVGACIGSYSLYPALLYNTRVIAFEPAYYNYNILQSNIELNQLHNLVTAYPVAIGKKYKYDYLVSHVNTLPGSGTNSISDSEISRHRSYDSKHGCIIDSINNLVRKGLPYPTHLKIDVDGTESDVIDGAIKVLPNLKSILIELMPNPGSNQSSYLKIKDEVKRTIKLIESFGFVLDEKLFNLSAKRHDHPNSKFKGQRNYIYYGEDYAV